MDEPRVEPRSRGEILIDDAPCCVEVAAGLHEGEERLLVRHRHHAGERLRRRLAAEPAKALARPRGVVARAGHDERQFGRVVRMANGVGLRDETAERAPDDDRPFDLERVAQTAHVVAPLRHRPQRGIAVIAASHAAVIVENDLRDVRQRTHHVAHVCVIGRPAVKRHDGRPLDHARPVGHELLPQDLDEQPNAVDGYAHGLLPSPKWHNAARASGVTSRATAA